MIISMLSTEWSTNYNKVLKNCKTVCSRPRPKTFIFVLETPQDQDPGLEDYITELVISLIH